LLNAYTSYLRYSLDLRRGSTPPQKSESLFQRCEPFSKKFSPVHLVPAVFLDLRGDPHLPRILKAYSRDVNLSARKLSPLQLVPAVFLDLWGAVDLP
jgi:hypothetical protein